MSDLHLSHRIQLRAGAWGTGGGRWEAQEGDDGRHNRVTIGEGAWGLQQAVEAGSGREERVKCRH